MFPSLLKMTDLDAVKIESLIKKAFEFKRQKDKNKPAKNILNGRVVVMIFEKQSLRTHVAFEVAAASLGGIPVFLEGAQMLAGTGADLREPVSDIGGNLGRFADLIIARVNSHSTVKGLADSSKKPVVNALCELHHPTQALADLMAIRWHKKTKKLKVAFIGDGNNVATSLMHICALTGYDFAIASPKGYEIPAEEQKIGAKLARKNKTNVEFLRNPRDAVKNADIVYTDTFVSMGQEKEAAKRLKDFKGYIVDSKLMKQAKKDALFMHCLPAHRGQEVTDEVISGPQSIVFDEAECRLYIAKALLYFYFIN